MPIYLVFCFTVGLGAAIWLPQLSILSQVFLVLFAFVAFFVPYCRAAGFLVVGLFIGYVQITHMLSKSFFDDAELITLNAVVQITSMPVLGDRSVRFKAKPLSLSCASNKSRWAKSPSIVNRVCEDVKSWQQAVVLSHYFHNDKTKSLIPAYQVGEVWRAQIKLRKPRGLVNEYGFDYQGWLLSNRIYATGYIVTKQSPVLVSGANYSAGFWRINIYFERMREHVSQWLTQSKITSASRPLLRALLIGDKSNMTLQQWNTLKSTGTIHLMAISGLHIGLAALMGFGLARCFFLICLYLGFKRLKLQKLPYVFSMLAAFTYAGLAGFSVPTVRALIMVLMVNLLYLVSKNSCPKRVLLLCAILVLLLEPFAFINTGFWLSFGAVALIFLFVQRSRNVKQTHEGIQKITGLVGFVRSCGWAVYNLTAMQFTLFVGLFIPVLLLSQNMSLVSPLANLLFVPFVSLIVVPLTFISALIGLVSVSFSYYLLQLTSTIIDIGWYVLTCLQFVQSYLDGVLSWFSFGGDVSAIIISGFCALLFMLPAGLKLRLCAFGLLIPLVFYRPLLMKDNKITVLDVGQGLGVLIQTPSATVLYDTGNYYSPSFDIGKSIISPLLVSQAAHHIDALFISHSDTDHVGGAKGVMDSHSIGQVVASVKDTARTVVHLPDGFSEQSVTHCYKGKKWVFDSIKITALWPSLKDAHSGLYKSTNNRSCVLLVELGGVKLLLMGDVNKQVEAELLADKLPQVDVLVAAHHGSLSSSKKAFIKQLNPKHVVFSAGYKNRYGHPHPKVIKRFDDMGARLYNTAYSGAVAFIPSQAGKNTTLKVTQAREESVFRWLK